MLSNALGGSEGHLGRMTAGEQWIEMQMGDLRDEAVRDVTERFQAGTLQWKDVATSWSPSRPRARWAS
eukprot:15435311-Alexandrium_andersonii.AAC.1